MTTDLHGLATVALLRRDELDREWPARVVGPVIRSPEQGFGVGVVVRHPWPGEGSDYSQLLQPAFERGSTQHFESLRLGVAIVGVQDQRLRAPFVDPLATLFRRRPEDFGEAVDVMNSHAQAQSNSSATAATPEPTFTVGQALRT